MLACECPTVLVRSLGFDDNDQQPYRFLTPAYPTTGQANCEAAIIDNSSDESGATLNVAVPASGSKNYVKFLCNWQSQIWHMPSQTALKAPMMHSCSLKTRTRQQRRMMPISLLLASLISPVVSTVNGSFEQFLWRIEQTLKVTKIW